MLLILAGISIAMLSGNNGILQRSREAKTQTGIEQEREIVALAYNSALVKKVGSGDSTLVTSEDMNIELTNQGATAKESNPIKVTFIESKRQYTVDNGIVTYVGNGISTLQPPVATNLTSNELAAIESNNIENPEDTVVEITSSVTNNNLKDTAKIKAVLTGDVPIPVGANYIKGTVDTGVVIEYKGSQFVWVPIPVTEGNLLYPKGTTKPMAKIATAEGYAGTDTNGRTNYEGVFYEFGNSDFGMNGPEFTAYSESQVMLNYGQGTTNYREPDIVEGYDNNTSKPSGSDYTYLEAIGLNQGTFKKEMQENYNAMIESVAKYGGFFVGKYETSIDSITIVASKAGTPMSEATDSQMWYGMYDKQKNFTTNSDVMQSSMIWGSQYDSMLNWMQNGAQSAKVNERTNGNHNGSPTTTGGTTTDIINNICDLEGNLHECTLEANDNYCRSCRGGDYYVNYPASNRDSSYAESFSNLGGSRLSLYIKN